MGNTLASVVKKFTNDPNKEKLAHDALNSLVAIARDRQTNFHEQIRSSDTNTLKISNIVYEYQFFQCGVSSDPTVITKTITDTLGSFISRGSLGDAIGKLVGGSLDILFGNYSANKSALTTYAITTGSLGGVARVDADFFSYEYRSKMLSDIATNVVVVSVVVSSVDITDLKKNDVNVIVESVYKAATNKDRVDIRDKIWNAIQNPDDSDDSDDSDDEKATAPKALNVSNSTGTKSVAIQGKFADPHQQTKSKNEDDDDDDDDDEDKVEKIIPGNPLDAYHPSVFEKLNDGIHRNFDFSQLGYSA